MENKIIAALERLSQALQILLWDIAKEERISPRQISFLLYMKSHQKEQCRVSKLANEFGLTQATVSDAIRILMAKGLISKKPYQKDGRVSHLDLTPMGKKVTARLSGWQDIIKEQINQFSNDTKENVMIFLMELILSLRNAGVINVARMCIACNFFQKDAHPGSNKPHYCRLTNRFVANSELNIDCNSHVPKRG